MYGYSKIRKDFLEKQIDIIVLEPSLENMVKKAVEESGFTGDIDFRFFPEEKLKHIPYQPYAKLQGSLLSVLQVLGKQFIFNVYTEGTNKLVVMYKPDVADVDLTDLFSGDNEITLSTDNMRSNPKIGPATLSIVSNLDTNIRPSSVLNISELLTIGTDVPEETLKITEEYLKKKVAGNSHYQVLSIQHKGSNWTGDWSTQAVALSPTPGTTMPSSNWWA